MTPDGAPDGAGAPTDDLAAGPDGDDASAATRTGASPGRVAVAVLLVVLAVGGVAYGVVQQQRHDDLRRDVDRRAAAADVAARFAERLLSYDHDDLDEQAAGIEALATEEFTAEYRRALDQGLAASIEELEASSSATISQVIAGDVEGGRARVIVVLDSEIRSEAGTRTSVGTYLDVALLHLDGRWQVHDVQTVANQSAGPEPAGGDG